MDFYKDYPEYKVNGQVDNQLGALHSRFRYYNPYRKGFELKLIDSDYQTAFIIEDVVPRNLAEEVRKFINEIPFDNTIKILADVINPPKDLVYKSLDDTNKIKRAYDNKKYAPNEWTWEKYDNDFWRTLPLSTEAFIGSPIIELFDMLETRWYQTKIDNFDIAKYRKATWVIQRIEEDHGISVHSDDNPWRKLAFVYYLTPDDWDYEIDGGELCVMGDNNEHISINPTFNTMVTWEMANHKSPLHFVEKVKAKNKSRIALVGFFNESS